MREILFRAYSKLLKEYIVSEFSIFGEWLTFDMFGQFISENWDKYKEHYDSKLIAVNDFVVEQYTGLKDMNGKKIFEGDIFSLGDPNILYIVQWHDTGFSGKQIRSTSYVGLSYWRDRIEIVGNIHDNPELLEVK